MPPIDPAQRSERDDDSMVDHVRMGLLGLSLFGTTLVYWLWFSVLEKAPLNRANAFSFLIPIFGLTMGPLFYGETLGWPQLVGIALTILGVGLVTRREGGARSAAVDK